MVMSSVTRRTLLLLILPVFLALQIWATFFHLGGGIAAKYSFSEGFTEFVAMSLEDPLLTAGLIDFMTIAVILVVWLIADLPAQRRWKPKTFVWLVSFIVFPGLGLLLYLLWLNPGHALMRDSG
jgi:hypothetical protein